MLSMSTEAPHPIHPSQPELDFAAPETAPEPAAAQPTADYDETPPPEAIELPPPPETTEISDEELEALDEMNAAATVSAVPLPAQPAHVATIVVKAPGFGEQLQSLRVQHKLTIGELAAKTHMTASAIQDLESGDVTRLNSNANYHYCRSQIERICQAYGEGISPEPILEALDQELQKHAPVATSEHGLAEETDDGFTEDRTRRFSSLLISLVIILLLLLILGGWAYKRYEIGRQEKSSADYDLPSLVPPPQLPLTPLDLPTP